MTDKCIVVVDDEELRKLQVLINNYYKLLEFVKEIAKEKLDRHEPLVEAWEEEANKLLEEIGEA